MVEIISKKCVDILPLKAEPISSWGKKSDLQMLLVEMYKLGGYSSYGEWLFKQGLKRWRKTLNEFQNNAIKAKPAPAAEGQVEPIPDLNNDEYFGLMAKYSIAWDGADSAVLSESAFFSLAHVLEAGSDLEASILLAANIYYRQALQSLRNYLESMVLQLYFCDSHSDFDSWKIGDFRVPRFRGKNGLLKSLENKSLLPLELSRLASDLYSDLSSSIHGAESHLLHTGVFEGKWAGRIFKYERLREWCEYFAQCVYFGVHILRLSTNLWLDRQPGDKIYCNVCHNEDITYFVIDKTQIDNGTVSFKCKKCGSEQHFRAEWAKKMGY